MSGRIPAPPVARSPSREARSRFVVLAAVVALAAAPGAGAAQIITGTITVEGTGEPARGAWIAVLDSLDQQRNAVLTDGSGRFAVRVAGLGPVHLRAQLIGHTDAVTEVMEVAPGQARSVSLTMRERALPLAAISVEAERRCAVTPDAGAAAILWEEVRKALDGVRLTGDANLVAYRVERFRRTYGLDNVLLRENLDTVVARGERPFTTPPPSELVRKGYVQGAESPAFYAPDAEVLLSDGFVDTHCFRALRGRGETASMVGLGFEPNADRDLPDVAGTLWIDTATSALRYLDFGYTGVDYGLRTRELGGRLDFARLETGAWIVEKWWIRAPVLLAR
ncbi:MAG: carboxypeptidase-like regulatory domain-containing protein, partial [Gemmatimonadota bacterium]